MMTNEERAVELLRSIREEAEARRQHFGNMNDINFEPGIATDANKQVQEIDAFLVAYDAAPKEPRLQEPEYTLRSFYEALEPLFDWMNGNDLSADWQRINPESYDAIRQHIDAIRQQQKAGQP